MILCVQEVVAFYIVSHYFKWVTTSRTYSTALRYEGMVSIGQRGYERHHRVPGPQPRPGRSGQSSGTLSLSHTLSSSFYSLLRVPGPQS